MHSTAVRRQLLFQHDALRRGFGRELSFGGPTTSSTAVGIL
jgi:hypothetical protein